MQADVDVRDRAAEIDIGLPLSSQQHVKYFGNEELPYTLSDNALPWGLNIKSAS